MARKLPLLFVIALMPYGAPAAGADCWWWPPELSLDPCLTVGQATSLTVTGQWPSDCPPQGCWIDHALPERLDFIVYTDYPPEWACLCAVTTWEQSDWAVFEAPGAYSVYATWYDLGACCWPGPPAPPPIRAGPTLVGEFVVHSSDLLGDLNCDGAANLFDVDPFVLALSDAASYEQNFPCCDRALADCNRDGLVNSFDIDPFTVLLTGNAK